MVIEIVSLVTTAMMVYLLFFAIHCLWITRGKKGGFIFSIWVGPQVPMGIYVDKDYIYYGLIPFFAMSSEFQEN